jgi:hypothetical protein
VRHEKSAQEKNADRKHCNSQLECCSYLQSQSCVYAINACKTRNAFRWQLSTATARNVADILAARMMNTI